MPCGVQPTSLERRSNSFLTSRRVAQTSVLSPGSLTHSASTLSLLRYLATSTQASFKHRNSQLALSSSYLTSCCRTHDNNPTCAHSTPAQHRAVTGAVFTMCVCAWRASALSSACCDTRGPQHTPKLKNKSGCRSFGVCVFVKCSLKFLSRSPKRYFNRVLRFFVHTGIGVRVSATPRPR